jgi:phosphatidylglycerophosphate synthase
MGFVFGFSLGQLLLRLGGLVIAWERVKPSALCGLATGSAILLVLTDWLSLYELRNSPHWTLLPIVLIFLTALSVCFICMIATPMPQAEGPIDMEAFYWHQRKTFFSAWLACELLATACNSVFLDTPKLLSENIPNLIAIPPICLALLVPHRWAQWTGLSLLTAITVFVLVTYQASLS